MMVSMSMLLAVAAPSACLQVQGSRRMVLRKGAAAASLVLPMSASGADALSARPEALRPLGRGTCSSSTETPEWLVGDWIVAASRLDGVAFPGVSSPPRTTAGARMGTILSLPNVGATPRGYRRVFGATLEDGDSSNAATTLAAFWPDVTNVVATTRDGRTRVDYTAPTVSKGPQRQRIVAERLGCETLWSGPTTFSYAERLEQSTTVDAAETPGLSGAYTSWHRFDVVDSGVRERLRVAAFDDAPGSTNGQPLAVYDYAFLLRRPGRRPRSSSPRDP